MQHFLLELKQVFPLLEGLVIVANNLPDDLVGPDLLLYTRQDRLDDATGLDAMLAVKFLLELAPSDSFTHRPAHRTSH